MAAALERAEAAKKETMAKGAKMAATKVEELRQQEEAALSAKKVLFNHKQPPLPDPLLLIYPRVSPPLTPSLGMARQVRRSGTPTPRPAPRRPKR